MNNNTESFTSTQVEQTDITTSATSYSDVLTSTTTIEPEKEVIAGSVCGAVALVGIILTALLCIRRYRGMRSRPGKPLPSLEDCNAWHSTNFTHRPSLPTGSNVDRSLGHESNAQNASQDAKLYENTVQRKKTPDPPARFNTPGYYIVPGNTREKPPIKPKPRPNLPPSGNGHIAKDCQPGGVMSPEQPCYLEVLPDSTGDELPQYSYVPTHWPPMGADSKQAPLDRQTSDSSMNYYNMPFDASYQNVKTKLQ